jgi:hypothetical protein
MFSNIVMKMTIIDLVLSSLSLSQRPIYIKNEWNMPSDPALNYV